MLYANISREHDRSLMQGDTAEIKEKALRAGFAGEFYVRTHLRARSSVDF